MVRSVTTVSADGHVTLPKAVRDRRNWTPGTRLVVESAVDGVILRREGEAAFPETTPSEVFGSLKYDGPPVSIEDMNDAIAIEVRRRRDLGRY